MRETRIIMGMSISLVVPDAHVRPQDMDSVFAEFTAVDAQFSPFKSESEISRLNRGVIIENDLTPRMREILTLCEKAKEKTGGYFDIIRPDGRIDLCGMVKGWAIRNAALKLTSMGFSNFCVAAGGDIQSHGRNDEGEEWMVGIRSPFMRDEIVKVLRPMGHGVATSGNYIRGDHIYNKHSGQFGSDNVVCLTLIGPDIMEADCYATAALAMGSGGIHFIERTPGLEAYEIDAYGMARITSGLNRYLQC
jgi:FAD:protein FMN transferase